MRTNATCRMFALLTVVLVLDRTPIATAQSERPSATALEAAAYRVLGSKHPDPAIRSADVLAEKLLGPAERAILKETGSTIVLGALAMDTEQAWTALGTRSVFALGVHVRTRHIDDVLAESLRAGDSGRLRVAQSDVRIRTAGSSPYQVPALLRTRNRVNDVRSASPSARCRSSWRRWLP
jgi:hypothetical protein